MGEVRSLNKNDFFYFAQFPLDFGWFVELLIGYCELQLTKIIKPYFGYRFSRRFKGVELARDRHRARAGNSARRRTGGVGPRPQGCGAFARDGRMPAGPSR